MGKYAKRYLVSWKSDDTNYGDDGFSGSTPSDFKAIVIGDSPPVNEVTTTVQNDEMTAVHSSREHEVYSDHNTVNFEIPIKPFATQGEEPPHGDLLKACNLEATLEDPDTTPASGDEFYSYSPITGNDFARVPSVSICTYLFDRDYSNAYKWLVTGIRGNLNWSLSMGQRARCTFDGIGLYSALPESTVTPPANPTEYSGELDTYLVVGMDFTVGGTSYTIEQMDFSTNWTIREDRSATAETGTLDAIELHREAGNPIGGGITFRGGSTVVADIVSKVRSGATANITASLDNGNEIVEYEFPSAQVTSEGLSLGSNPTHDISFQARGNWDGSSEGGENDLKISHKPSP